MRSLALAIALAVAGCSAVPAGAPPPAVYEWVPPDRYCARIEAIGCPSVCDVGTLCRRDLADRCLDEVEAVADSCEVVPLILAEDPVCAGFCVPADETYQPGDE